MTVELDKLTEGQEFVCARDSSLHFSVQDIHIQSIEADELPMNLYGFAYTATEACKDENDSTPCPDNCPVRELLIALDQSSLKVER
ncbi:hypothetical protein A2961_04555 [Candidatus Woesebacteria bacterium RIFCSPLOWO2_01_FULL_39_21]|uniref:Uncharacterized protein n=1 Tax=Candidatus Woesebacteria bacterium RIFCSPLOWO2_01_FULL_39_21 TaxID=1802519 RepID=A0A1F8BD85_9BACT|nr:MAG: hypothetical protein A2691_02930 [Candidatus Woesebacteria bacterium RIFCSPHIGHO2_01_FULL_39_23]OGM62017.1 MAG: hypothetical protein A2961_04555 [Candidatus Woesebacteria bacterium RIFCSPLOWO2_01_FULL_39_21]